MQFDFAFVDWSDEDSNPFDQCECSSSSNSSNSSQCSGNRAITIRFAQEDEIFEIPHIKDFSPLQIEATWYRPEEFRAMRSQVQQVIAEHADSDCDVSSSTSSASEAMRGLEYRTPQGNMKRSWHKRQAYASVLEEQERQWLCARHDPERIAAAYMLVSTKCHGLALFQGLKDEQDAKACRDCGDEQSPSSTGEINNNNSNSTTAATVCKTLDMQTSCYRRIAVLDETAIKDDELVLCSQTGPAAA